MEKKNSSFPVLTLSSDLMTWVPVDDGQKDRIEGSLEGNDKSAKEGKGMDCEEMKKITNNTAGAQGFMNKEDANSSSNGLSDDKDAQGANKRPSETGDEMKRAAVEVAEGTMREVTIKIGDAIFVGADDDDDEDEDSDVEVDFGAVDMSDEEDDIWLDEEMFEESGVGFAPFAIVHSGLFNITGEDSDDGTFVDEYEDDSSDME